jgi:hypothetical protein
VSNQAFHYSGALRRRSRFRDRLMKDSFSRRLMESIWVRATIQKKVAGYRLRVVSGCLKSGVNGSWWQHLAEVQNRFNVSNAAVPCGMEQRLAGGERSEAAGAQAVTSFNPASYTSPLLRFFAVDEPKHNAMPSKAGVVPNEATAIKIV